MVHHNKQRTYFQNISKTDLSNWKNWKERQSRLLLKPWKYVITGIQTGLHGSL